MTPTSLLEIVTAPILGDVRHGFFTRKGGASSGVFAGLNCGAGSSDQAEAVQINRARVAAAMGVGPETLVSLHQVHSAQAVVVDDSGAAPQKADAMVTATPGIALAILTADCQPVLFVDPDAGVIGAAHAGWRGALAGILDATVETMEELGARREQICAAIGPTISQRAYEVGPEFFETFLDDDPANARFFAQGNGDRLLFDLAGYSLARLRRLGVGHAEWTRHCTYSDPERFYSFRRSVHMGEADYGRLVSVIRL